MAHDGPAPDIFLSYNREDQAVARRFAEAFEGQGFSVWWDVTLRSGEAYDEITETALKTAKAVVVLWSKKSVVSRWVRAEATLADRNRTLAPCMIEPCERPVMFELVQTAELSHWDGAGDDKAWLAFLADVQRLVGRETRAAPKAEPSPMRRGERPSLAMLPLANLSNDPEQTYFADGMTQEITTALSRVRSLFVIASTSTSGFTGAVDVKAIGRQLGVRYVLQGSVRRSGDRVRIAVNLVDAVDGAQLWAERYDDTIDDVFALQDRVALSVAGVIEPAVLDAEIRRAVRRPTTDITGYDLYLRAIALMDTFEKPAMFEAIDLLDRALALDPKFALAMSVLSYAHGQIVVSQWAPDFARHRALALDFARRAVQLAGDDAEVLSWVVGAYLALQEDVETSMALATRCITINPGSAQGWMMSGWLHMSRGDSDLAIAHLETCMRLDPNSTDRRFHLGGVAFARFAKGEFAEAARLLKEVIHLQPTVSMNFALLASAQGHLGQIEAARETITRYRALSDIDMRERLTNYRDPAQRKLFLDGLDLAEGKG
ncbi:MAG: TIR domain-containing protein [Alphaproteobacteria bacterium]|nr:TIR domain-containing protein [Alphaproteobacteria bacterium]